MDVNQAFLELEDQTARNDDVLADGNDLNRVVRVYVKIRDKRAANKKVFDDEDKRLEAQQTELRAVLLEQMNKQNLEAISTEAGTVYRHIDHYAKCDDWGLFWEWLCANGSIDMMQKRLSNGTIKQYMDEHAGQLPPGVSVFKEADVRLRRK